MVAFSVEFYSFQNKLLSFKLNILKHFIPMSFYFKRFKTVEILLIFNN